MASAIKVKSEFRLAEVDLDRRLADEASYLRKLRKLQTAMLDIEEIYRVERRRGIVALEGWDAAGKSGAIGRLIEKLDPALGAGLADRPAEPRRTGPPLSVALLAKAAIPRPNCDLRPQLVRSRTGRARRRLGPAERVAPRL